MNSVDLGITSTEAPRTQAAFRLLRMILIDSYSSGRTVEVNLDGHLTLTGENGGGKTTLLRLIPIFFGESPSRVIQSDDNNFSFARHYFARTSSYIVFEYERRGSKVLSVIHPDGQSDSVIYRFIDCAYRPELFTDATGPIQTRDFTRHLTKLGVVESKPLTMAAYRSILQNNTTNREHRQLATKYAFVGSGGHLTHIERVITAILQRATTFHDLKRMIVSSVLESQQVFSMRTGKRELLHWIGEYEAHHAIMERTPIMEGLERDDAQRRAHEQDFARVHASLQLLHDHFQTIVIDGEKAEAALTLERETATARFNNLVENSSDHLSAERSSLRNARLQLTAALDRRKAYDSSEILEEAACVDAIPSNEERRRQLSSQIAVIESSAESIVNLFDGLANDASKAAKADIERHEAKRTTLLVDYATRAEKQNDEQRAELEAAQTRHRREESDARDGLSALMVEEGKLQLQSQNPPRNEHLDSVLAEERRKLAEASEDLAKLHDRTATLDGALKKAQTAFNEAEEMLNGSLTTVEKIELEIDSLLAAGNAGENTLLGFLRTHKPDWHLDIGRLVSEETLLRTDLAPYLAEGQDLYGVGISIEKIAAGRLTSEESIQNELARLRNLLADRKKDVDADRKILSEKAEARDRAKKALDAHSATLIQSKQTCQAHSRQVETAEGHVTAALASAKRAALAALQTCQANLKDAQEAVRKVMGRHVTEVSSLKATHASARKDMQTEHQKALGAINNTIRERENDLQQELGRITAQRDASLIEKGVDVKVLNGLKEQIVDLDKKLNKGRLVSSRVLAYRTWIEDVWLKKDELQSAVTEWVRKEAAAVGDHEKLLAERKRVTDELGRQLKELSDAIDAANRSVRAAATHMYALVNWPKDEAILRDGLDAAWTIDGLSERRRDLQRSYEEIQRRIRDGVDDIRKEMIACAGTGPEKYHNTIYASIGQPITYKEHLWIDALRGWFNHEQSINRSSVIQMAKAMALDISSFWDGLGKFKKEVDTFATDLRQHLHRGQIFSNISDVSATISTDIDKQGYWKAIESLHFEFEAWHSTNGSNLPPPSFIDAAKAVAAVIGDDRGLVTNPVDLLSLQITARIDGDSSKVANSETALARMSSNGLSYVILCVILLGFINRIRRKESVQIPYPVDELRDLSTNNATALLGLLAQNNMTLIAAFPDIDPDLAPFFERNYRIQPGRVLASVVVNEEDKETAHV